MGSVPVVVYVFLFQKVDLAAAPITITTARSEVVVFTAPILSFRMVLLMTKPPADVCSAARKIKSLKDLSEQTEIGYGIVRNGATEDYFRSTAEATHRKIYEEMMKNKSTMASTSAEGVEMVRAGGGQYAFIVEGGVGEYWAKRRPCDLAFVPLADMTRRNYAFVVRKGSTLKAELNMAIDDTTKRELAALKARWWSNECLVSVSVSDARFEALLVLIALVVSSLSVLIDF